MIRGKQFQGGLVAIVGKRKALWALVSANIDVESITIKA
jgi:hypothetical protein